MAATFASSQSSVAYDKSASQATGALNTGMGYDPNTATTVTKTTQYMGGAVETIGYGKGVALQKHASDAPLKKSKAVSE